MLSEIIQSERWSTRELLGIRRHATTSSVAAPWVCAEKEVHAAREHAITSVIRMSASAALEVHLSVKPDLREP